MKKSKQANAIADPEEYPQEFGEGWDAALDRERQGGVAENLVELDHDRDTHLTNGVERLSLENGSREKNVQDEDLLGELDGCKSIIRLRVSNSSRKS